MTIDTWVTCPDCSEIEGSIIPCPTHKIDSLGPINLEQRREWFDAVGPLTDLDQAGYDMVDGENE